MSKKKVTKKASKKVVKKVSKKKTSTKLIESIENLQAIEIFEALGFKTANKWTAARLESKLKNLKSLAEGTEVSSEIQKMINSILKTQKADKVVKVIDVENAAEDKKLEKEVKAAGKRAKTKKEEKKSKGKKEKKVKVKKEKKEKTETIKSKLFAALRKKPKTHQQLIKEIGSEKPQSGYLNLFVKQGLAIKSDKGYSLK